MMKSIVDSVRLAPMIGLIACAGTIVSAQQLESSQGQPERTTAAAERSTDEPSIYFGNFSEPIELATLIDFVGSSLNINIVVKGSPTGEVVFNAPIRVPKSELIELLDAMLEQFNFAITYEPDSQFYIVQPITDVRSTFGTDRASTRIVSTPNIKPSLLVPALSAILKGASTAPGAQSSAIQAVDELGVLIINAPSRDIRRVELMIEELIRLDVGQEYIRFDLNYLAAPTALDRVIRLVGGSSNTGGTTNFNAGNRNNQNNQQGNVATGIASAGGTLSNLADRITIDPQGNALIFKGTEDEIGRVRTVLAVIDVPNTLIPKNYFAGASASQIADIANRRGLGEVIEIESSTVQNPFNNFGGQNNQFNVQTNEQGLGGPMMVVDPERGNILYYGTDDQQAQLSALLEELRTEDERVVIREYLLNHTDALTIADLLNGIISGELQTGDSALLPGSSGRNTNTTRSFINGFPINTDGESSGEFDPNKITVIPDEFSNQIIIKAPIKQQEDLEGLIVRLDRQRSQVYIQALIVAVTDNEDFTLAIETQINAGQYSAATNFGLSSAGTTFQDPRSVASNLGGLTQAVIMSEYVPLIVNATQTNQNVQILSTPQLLVNDNEESEIVSIEEQPYSEITSGNNGGDSLQGLGGYVEAGTTLRVTPSISKAGFIRLEYYVELSNFVGLGSNGLPPGTTRRQVEGSATVPSNATIVIGGITVEDIRDTVIKVPLLGDIPLVGELFKRTNKVNNKSKLYVFLTPRIMADPNFNDLRINTEGPQSDMNLDKNVPELDSAMITTSKRQTRALPEYTPESSEPVSATPAPLQEEPAPASAPSLEPVYIELTDVPVKDDE